MLDTARVYDSAGVRLAARGRLERGRPSQGQGQVRAQVLRRPQEGGHGEQEEVVLRGASVLPEALLRHARGEGKVLRGAQGGPETVIFACLRCRELCYNILRTSYSTRWAGDDDIVRALSTIYGIRWAGR